MENKEAPGYFPIHLVCHHFWLPITLRLSESPFIARKEIMVQIEFLWLLFFLKLDFQLVNLESVVVLQEGGRIKCASSVLLSRASTKKGTFQFQKIYWALNVFTCSGKQKTGAKAINVVSEDIQKNDWTFRHITIYIVFGVSKNEKLLVSEELLDSHICMERPQKESLSYSK